MVELAQVVDINLWAVLVAALAMMALGAVWYSPVLFGKQWQTMVMAWTKMKEKDFKEGANIAYLGSSLAYLVMAYVLAYLLGLLEATSWQEGVTVAGWIALGFLVTRSLTFSLFHDVRKKLWAINTGYDVVGLLMMGAIIGGWQV